MYRNSASSSFAALALAALLLVGCSAGSDVGAQAPANDSQSSTAAETQAPPAEPLDLVGEWKQTNSNSPDSYQTATIEADTIRIDWINEENSSSAIYWVGTYDAPTEHTETYTWDSQNDTSQTDNALMASGDPTKTFTYEDGKLKYELTAMGVTMTVELEKQ